MRGFFRKWFFLISAVGLCFGQTSANTLQIRKTDQPIEITPYIHYGKVNFSVQSGKLITGISDSTPMQSLADDPILYHPENQKTLSWFDLVNASTEQHWYLCIDFFPLNRITLFLTDSAGNILDVQHGGSLQKMPTGFHDRTSHLFPLQLIPNQHYKAYVFVETESFFLFPASFHTATTLLAKKSNNLLYIWITFGIVLAAFILNFTLFISTRERPFLILMALMLMLVSVSYYQYGFGFEVFPNLPDFFKIRVRALLIAPVCILLNLFTIYSFQLKQFKPLWHLFRLSNLVLILYGVLLLTPAVPFRMLNSVSPVLLTATIAFNLIAAISALRNNRNLALWFILGLLMVVISSSVFTLVLYQVIPFYTPLYHANYYGTALFCLMLTLGMHMKIAAIRNSAYKLEVSQQLNTELQAALKSNLVITGMLEERTRELEAEQQTTRLLTSAVESSDSIIVITNPEGIIEYVNPAFTRITGYQPAEAIGRKPSLLKSGTHDTLFYQSLWQTITAGETWHGEFFNKRKDGTLY